MSRRTSEASKAVRLAWQNEQSLVLEGKGTRDWTQEQQKSIIEKGKAYDENGKAFEGHHMKSAEAFPEYQGFQDNIEFLTRSEHKDAHGSSFQNSTNGYYNPITLTTSDFGENPYTPCPILELSNPILYIHEVAEDGVELSSSEESNTIEENSKAETVPLVHKETIQTNEVTHTPINRKLAESRKSGIVKVFFQKAVKFSQEHPIVTCMLVTAGSALIDEALKKWTSSDSSNDARPSISPGLSPETDEDQDPETQVSPGKRASPVKHPVKKHSQRYHTKEGTITKEKESYERGGKTEKE